MSFKILKKEKNVVTVEFTVSKEIFKDSVNEAYEKNKNTITIPGFRKGKAPKSVIEKKFGKGVFYDDALDIAIQKTYPKAIEELKIDVIDSPKVNIEKFEENEDIILTADVEVMPEVELAEYKGVEVERFDLTVSDEDVEAELKKIQQKNARIAEVTDRSVQMGDILTIDYTGFVGEDQFEGGTAEGQSLEIGSNTFIPGFEEQLVGKNIGEEFEINVTFPELYHSEDLKGKDAIFKVKIHDIKGKEVDEIDDEFAKDVSEFDTLEEFKASIKAELEKKAADQVKITNDNNVVTKIVNDSKVEIPNVLIERELEHLGKTYENQFRSQGFSGKEYDDIIKSFVKQYKEGSKDQAEFNVKAELVLSAIIEKENITATNEELNEEVEKMAKAYNVEDDRLENFKQTMLEANESYLNEIISKRKAIQMLVENANFVEKKEETTEEIKKEDNSEK